MDGALRAGWLAGLLEDADRRVDRLVLPPGPLAARLVVTGLPVGDLAAGARLRVGAEVTLELGVAGPAGGGGVEEDGATRVPALVVEGGTVAVGDAVQVDAVVVPIVEALDLHSFRPAEVPEVVAEYLRAARAAGLGEVRVIHGRGHGVQRAAVRRLLARLPGVAGFADAPEDRGGWGATLVRLDPPGAGPTP